MGAWLGKAAAWAQAPENGAELIGLGIGVAVLALAVAAGVFAALGNAQRRARAFAAQQQQPNGEHAPRSSPTVAAVKETAASPQAAYDAILRLTPQDERAKAGRSKTADDAS